MIPTRNRAASLERTLRALGQQTRAPEEVVVVDASDLPLDEDALQRWCGASLTHVRAQPGVCAQRNLGIRRATGSHVLLCDDDIEPPPHYLQRLTDYLISDPKAGVVTGVISDHEGAAELSSPSLRHLLFAFVFQLSVWGDVEQVKSGPLASLLKRWYRYRGNSWSLAGWPLVTQVRTPIMRSATYGLGAALIRRDWLLAAPFDERLGTYGIGDNYGLALSFPATRAIAVLTDLPVLHHRAPEHRLDASEAYFQRLLAIDYFMRTSRRFTQWNRAWLAWSLVGKALVSAVRGPRALLRPTARALALVVTGRNPLLVPPTHARDEISAAHR